MSAVKEYTRTTRTGKTVQVKSYTRDDGHHIETQGLHITIPKTHKSISLSLQDAEEMSHGVLDEMGEAKLGLKPVDVWHQFSNELNIQTKVKKV
jgi:hypothetical protein